MHSLFGLPVSHVMWVLLIACLAIFTVLGVVCWRNQTLLQMGLRNLPRRRSQTVLIICGLAVSTMSITSAFGVGDTVSFSFRRQITQDIGPVDEIITSTATGPATTALGTLLNGGPYFPLRDYDLLVAPLTHDPRIAAITPLLVTEGSITALASSRRKPNVAFRSLPALGDPLFTTLPDLAGGTVSLAELGPGELYLNSAAATELQAGADDELQVTLDQHQTRLRVRAIVKRDGLAGHEAMALTTLRQMQTLLGRSGQINLIAIANRGGGTGLVSYSKEIASSLRAAIIATPVAREIRKLLSRPEVFPELVRLTAQTREENQRAKLAQTLGELRAPETAPVSEHFKNLLDDSDVNGPLWTLAATLPSKSLGLRLSALLAQQSKFTVREVKVEGLTTAELSGNLFTTIFIQSGFFSIGIGMLLIFLIFVLLAAERRGEMGISRAVGMRRLHLVEVFLFEGATYDLAASFLGVAAGVGIGLLLISGLGAVTSGCGELCGGRVAVEPHFEIPGLVISYCLGILLTFGVVGYSSWRVSRLNIVSAIRNLPEPTREEIPLRQLVLRPLRQGALGVTWLLVGRPLKALVCLGGAGAAMGRCTRIAIGRWTRRGPLLVLFGLLLAPAGVAARASSLLNLGLSLLLIGASLMVRWLLPRLAPAGENKALLTRKADRLGFSLAGLLLLVYWALPPNFVISLLGLPDLPRGAADSLFLSGIMTIAGAVWAIVYNADLLLRPVSQSLGRLGSLAPVIKMAIAYPLQQKFRTGMALLMFALVIFLIMFVACLSSTISAFFDDTDAVTGGFALRAVSASEIEHIQAAVTASPRLRQADFTAIASSGLLIGSLRQPLRPGERLPAEERRVDQSLGIISGQTQPNNGQSWASFPLTIVDEPYLAHTTYRLSTRAIGFNSDREVWAALRTHPGYAVIDGLAVPARNGSQSPPQRYVFALRGLYHEDKQMQPVVLELLNPLTTQARTLTIIGVIDSRAFASMGVMTSVATLDQAHYQHRPLNTYYFALNPAVSAQQEAQSLTETFQQQGLSCVVLADESRGVRDSIKSLYDLIQDFAMMGLLVGIVALGVINSRAVVERRQQIGMLRAIGFSKAMIAITFLVETSFVTLVGTTLGLALGMLISYTYITSLTSISSGLTFVAPWRQVFVIGSGAYLASLLTTWLPAYQASQVFPAEALRYE